MMFAFESVAIGIDVIRQGFHVRDHQLRQTASQQLILRRIGRTPRPWSSYIGRMDGDTSTGDR